MNDSNARKKVAVRFRIASGFLIASYLICVVHPVSLKIKRASADVVSAFPARAECVIEANSRRILYEHNAEEKLPMASTTKILTAITVLEMCGDLETEFPIPAEAEGVEGSSVYLKSGEYYSPKDLLYGLMLRSGNDCAEALALHVCGSLQAFAAKMNETAQKSGALNSNFENPHGLPHEGHYTTARDLSLISCYAMQNEFFREIVSTRYYEPRNWANKNKLLKNYEGACGIKTGYTKQAGRCLVSAARRGNMTLVCTLLNCPQTYERTAQLFDDAFRAYENVCLLKRDDPVKISEKGKEYTACTREDIYYPLLPEEKSLVEIHVKTKKDGFRQKKNGEIIGEIEITLLNRLLFSGNLYKL